MSGDGATIASRHGERGFALVVTLGFVVILALAAASVAATSRLNGAMLRNNTDLIRARELARAGLEVALADLARPLPERVLPRDATTLDLALADGTATVAIADERGKLDLNEQTPEVLARAFALVAADAGVMPPNVEPLLAIRGRRRLAHVSELESRVELPPAFVAALLPSVTVMTREAKINVLTADERVLRSLPNVTPALIAQIRTARSRRSRPPNLAGAQQFVTEEEGPGYTISVTGRLAVGPVARIEALVTVGAGSDGGPRVTVLEQRMR